MTLSYLPLPQLLLDVFRLPACRIANPGFKRQTVDWRAWCDGNAPARFGNQHSRAESGQAEVANFISDRVTAC